VGTSSVKLHVAERDAEGEWHDVADRAQVTRLGEGLARDGRLGALPIARTVDTIANLVEEARELGVEAVAAVGTAGLRIAPNGSELVEAVEARCGVTVEIIGGGEEARLGYLAVRSGIGLGDGSLVVFDTGGGSSQFTFGHGRHVDEQFSVAVGAARLTDRFGLDGAVSKDVVAEARAAIAADLGRLDDRPRADALVGIGGAVTNLAAVKLALAAYDPELVRGAVLERAEIDRQLELYRSLSADDRRGVVGLQPGRAEVILAGVCIVATVLDKLGRESLTVSDRGLRHGLLLERFGSE
jgi:exopolyphosphatase/guanosine-5'-triphosphate,3'-diphosphate pyrophosphatase